MARAAKVKLEVEPTPKDRSQWTFLTKTSPAKVQIPEIVNGAAVYGMDVRLPNMVYVALRQSPVHGGKFYDPAYVSCTSLIADVAREDHVTRLEREVIAAQRKAVANQ